ncbi:MAG: hypothetical protein QM405_01960 [Euryarchaeota archaeon]|jgi:hypothetical protein|nr:hypothetical protein [Euryarchaeota archaeon]
MVDKKIGIADSGIGNDEINISVFRTGSLLPCARYLANIAKNSVGTVDEQCFTMSTIIMCTAAIEASLFEYAYNYEKTIYKGNGFARSGIALKYKALKGNKLEDDFKDVDELITIRNAIVHNEPDHKSGRELDLAKELNKNKALWAVKTTETFVKAILQKNL